MTLTTHNYKVNQLVFSFHIHNSRSCSRDFSHFGERWLKFVSFKEPLTYYADTDVYIHCVCTHIDT